MKTPLWLSKSGRSTRASVIAALLAVALLLFYPFQTTIVPEWTLKVVDEEGAAVREVNVTEHWQHFLLENEAHEELKPVADNGSVEFPARTIRASLMRRGVATIRRIEHGGWRARRSPAASIVVWGNKEYATTVAVYDASHLPQSHVTVPSLK